MGNSGPCSSCHEKILKLGVKKMVYSDENNQLVSVKPCHYHTQHITLGHKYEMNGFKFTNLNQDLM